MLTVEQIDVSYGDLQVLRGVSLAIHRGEIVALVGSNGAGKTTTLRAISGLLRPRHGQIIFEGRRIDLLPPHHIVELGIVQVPEGRRLFPAMSVLENLELGAYNARARSEKNHRMDLVFSLFPRLAERRKQLAGTMSGGEQQMLAIGRALMTAPRLLMLDEPSLGLAPLVTTQILDTIKRLNHEYGTTILLVEQNVAHALAMAHRAYVIENGSVVLEGTGEELARDPAVRRAYLGL